MARGILGSGWKFPVRLTGGGGFAMASGEQDVAEAIWILLATSRGERLMRPEVGAGLADYVFAPNNAGTRGSIAYQVQQALVRWEPRIDILDVRVEEASSEPNLLLVHVDYKIRANNAFHNLVYPFFLNEGPASR